MDGSLRRGFTVVELLMSAAIVSLLIAATLPGLRAARLVAQELACKANLRSLGTATITYYGDWGDVPLPPTQCIDVPAGRLELVRALGDYLDAAPPSMSERVRPWACPSDTLRWPDTGGSYVYYPRILYETFVVQTPHTSLRAIMRTTHQRIGLFFDWYPQHGPRFNVVYFDGGVDSLREWVGYAYR